MSISGVKRSMDQEGCQNRIAHPRFQVVFSAVPLQSAAFGKNIKWHWCVQS